jgi:two-component system, chemotaxis family, CheB/CheR fusion protein
MKAPQASRCRVLIIEDNGDSAEMLQDVLVLAGHIVEIAPNGPAGLTLARTFLPDVVICDIGLPGMDGYAVAHAFRREQGLNRPHLIALTGYALPEDRQRALDAGFNVHLVKPPNVDVLEGLMVEIAESRARTQPTEL